MFRGPGNERVPGRRLIGCLVRAILAKVNPTERHLVFIREHYLTKRVYPCTTFHGSPLVSTQKEKFARDNRYST